MSAMRTDLYSVQAVKASLQVKEVSEANAKLGAVEDNPEYKVCQIVFHEIELLLVCSCFNWIDFFLPTSVRLLINLLSGNVNLLNWILFVIKWSLKRWSGIVSVWLGSHSKKWISSTNCFLAQLIVECNSLMVDVENEITIIHNFIRDKYRLKFPELESLVMHPIDYARVVKTIGNEMVRLLAAFRKRLARQRMGLFAILTLPITPMDLEDRSLLNESGSLSVDLAVGTKPRHLLWPLLNYRWKSYVFASGSRTNAPESWNKCSANWATRCGI